MQRPPPGLSARDFFESWLPEIYADTGRVAAADAPLVRASLSGVGGGQWDVQPMSDHLHVAPLLPADLRRAAPPALWVRQGVNDFQAALHGDPDLPDLLPPKWTALDLLFLDDRDLAMLRQVDGRILVEVEGKRRRRWALDVAFGPAGVAAGRPRASVRTDGATYEGVTTGQMPPLQALLQGKVRIEGDRTLAMQTMLLMGQRLAR